MGVEEFRKYCEERQNQIDPQGSNPEHERLANMVYRNPGMVGIHEKTERYRKVGLWDEEVKWEGCADVVLITDCPEEVYVCEVKSGLNNEWRSNNQLRRAARFINAQFGITPRCVFVRRNFEGELKVKEVYLDLEEVIEMAKAHGKF